MAVTIKDFAELIGFPITGKEEDVKSEDIKSYLDDKYILKANAHADEGIKKSVVGGVMGKISKKIADKFGFKDSEIDGKEIEVIVGLGVDKLNTEIKALKEAAPKTDDEKVKTLEKKIGEYELKIPDYESKITEWENKYNTDLGAANTNLKAVKQLQKERDIIGSINFIDEFEKNELQKEGFFALINKKYARTLDDKGELIVTNTDGTPVKHPKKTGHFANFEEVLIMEAEANKLLKKNNAEPVAVRKTILNTGKEAEIKRVNPATLKHLETLLAAEKK